MTPNKKPTVWLLSLHRYYIDYILDGVKKYEYRKVKMGCAPGDKVLMYATKPDGVILGEFTVGEGSIFGGNVINTIMETAPQDWDSLYPWAARAKSLTALEAVDIVKYDPPRSLEEMTGLTRGPMSYCRVTLK